MMKINNNKFADVTLELLQFIMEIVGKPSASDETLESTDSFLLSKSVKVPIMNINPSKAAFSNIGDDDYSKLSADTKNLAKHISLQKQKIENMYTAVKCTITKSISLSPGFSRPASTYR